MTPKDFIGSEAIHDEYGLVFVDSAPPRSKAMVNITVKQRGKGWNEDEQRYKKYRNLTTLNHDMSRTLSWGLTRKDEYGITETVHINTLVIKF